MNTDTSTQEIDLEPPIELWRKPFHNTLKTGHVHVVHDPFPSSDNHGVNYANQSPSAYQTVPIPSSNSNGKATHRRRGI